MKLVRGEVVGVVASFASASAAFSRRVIPCYDPGMEYRPGMFRSWRPLFWISLATAAFYAYAFTAWPLVMTAIFAAAAGVLLSIGVGSWIRNRVAVQREDAEFAEMVRREIFQEDLRKQAEDRRDSLNETGDRDG